MGLIKQGYFCSVVSLNKIIPFLMIYGAGMRYRRKFSTHMQLFAKALGSQTTCRKHCYKATFFFFFSGWFTKNAKQMICWVWGEQNTNINEVIGLVKNDSSLRGKKGSEDWSVNQLDRLHGSRLWCLECKSYFMCSPRPLLLSFPHEATTVYWLSS